MNGFETYAKCGICFILPIIVLGNVELKRSIRSWLFGLLTSGSMSTVTVVPGAVSVDAGTGSGTFLPSRGTDGSGVGIPLMRRVERSAAFEVTFSKSSQSTICRRKRHLKKWRENESWDILSTVLLSQCSESTGEWSGALKYPPLELDCWISKPFLSWRQYCALHARWLTGTKALQPRQAP